MCSSSCSHIKNVFFSFDIEKIAEAKYVTLILGKIDSKAQHSCLLCKKLNIASILDL